MNKSERITLKLKIAELAIQLNRSDFVTEANMIYKFVTENLDDGNLNKLDYSKLKS